MNFILGVLQFRESYRVGWNMMRQLVYVIFLSMFCWTAPLLNISAYAQDRLCIGQITGYTFAKTDKIIEPIIKNFDPLTNSFVTGSLKAQDSARGRINFSLDCNLSVFGARIKKTQSTIYLPIQLVEFEKNNKKLKIKAFSDKEKTIEESLARIRLNKSSVFSETEILKTMSTKEEYHEKCSKGLFEHLYPRINKYMNAGSFAVENLMDSFGLIVSQHDGKTCEKTINRSVSKSYAEIYAKSDLGGIKIHGNSLSSIIQTKLLNMSSSASDLGVLRPAISSLNDAQTYNQEISELCVRLVYKGIENITDDILSNGEKRANVIKALSLANNCIIRDYNRVCVKTNSCVQQTVNKHFASFVNGNRYYKTYSSRASDVILKLNKYLDSQTTSENLRKFKEAFELANTGA